MDANLIVTILLSARTAEGILFDAVDRGKVRAGASVLGLNTNRESVSIRLPSHLHTRLSCQVVLQAMVPAINLTSARV